VSAAFEPIEFLETAVGIDSTDDPVEMRSFLVETLADAGVDPTVDDAGNVLASRGHPAPDGPHVVLNTHVDTVPPHLAFERDGDTIRGRGACDAAGPLAAILDAFLATDPGDGRLTLAVTSDEETLSTGAHALVTREDSPLRTADCVVVGEPTELDVCTAAKGRFQGTIELAGVAAHAAAPDSGTNAVAAAAPVLRALETFDAERGPGTHDQLGAPTLQPTLIDGGEATNQLPERCTITFDRRSVPPETAEGFRAGLEGHCRESLPASTGLAVSLTDRPTPFLEAFATDPDAEVVGLLADAAGGGVRPFGAATEASYFAAHAPTVVFGPGALADETGAVAHAEREYVRVPEVRAAAAALRETLAGIVGT